MENVYSDKTSVKVFKQLSEFFLTDFRDVSLIVSPEVPLAYQKPPASYVTPSASLRASSRRVFLRIIYRILYIAIDTDQKHLENWTAPIQPSTKQENICLEASHNSNISKY